MRRRGRLAATEITIWKHAALSPWAVKMSPSRTPAGIVTSTALPSRRIGSTQPAAASSGVV
jgi:hypothetical protein